jgi:hypothetical protein
MMMALPILGAILLVLIVGAVVWITAGGAPEGR